MKFFYYIEKCRSLVNNIIILTMFVLAGLWVIYPKSDIEPILALMGVIGMILANLPKLYRYFGYNPHPLGEGVIGRGSVLLQQEREDIQVVISNDELKESQIEISYSPESEVRAIISGRGILFSRRDKYSKKEIIIDWKAKENG